MAAAGARNGQDRVGPRGGGIGLVLLLLSGCAFGPHVLEGTHGKYQESVKQVQDEEFLRNLVRLRYEDSLNLLDVASIASQFEVNAGTEARPFGFGASSNGKFRSWNPILPFASVQGANRPTFTLIPMDDADTVERFLTPASAESIIFFVESGWPVAGIFRLWLDAINHVPNAIAAGGSGSVRAALPDYERFRRIVDLLQSLLNQNAARFVVVQRDAIQGVPMAANLVTPETQVEAVKSGLRFVPGTNPQSLQLVKPKRTLVLKIHPLSFGRPELAEFCDALGLQPGLTEYEVTVGQLPPYPDRYPPERLTQIDLVPRSSIKALYYLSHGVAVPPEHLETGLARTAIEPDGRPFDWRTVTANLFQVNSVKAHKRPSESYVAIRYRGYWYYIDDRDSLSKSMFNLMLQLTRIDLGTDSKEARQAVPILTIPVSGR